MLTLVTNLACGTLIQHNRPIDKPQSRRRSATKESCWVVFEGVIMSMLMRVLALTLVLAACGGGGGGSPIPPDDTTPPPGDTEGFYPLAQGDTWYYGWTSSEAFGTALIRVQVEASRNVAGREAAVLAEVDLGSGESAAESYAVKDARAYTVLGNNDPDDFLTPKLVPYDEMRFPVALKSFTALDKNGADLGLDIDGDGHNE